jgi:NADPH:quinone reductase
VKAVRIYERGGPEVMVLEEMEVPAPGAGEVLIQVKAAGVNNADVGQRRGTYPNLVDLPATLGHEVAGIVMGHGADVNNLPEGTRVVALVDAGYAEYALADAQVVIPLPDEVSFAEATMIPIQGQTAYLLLTEAARLREGEAVLVHAAAGGVGTLAIQLARLLGAGMVIGTARTPEELAVVRQLGADVALDISAPDWVEQVRAATRGRGVDIVLESVGGPVGQQSLACMAPFGRMIVFGSLSGQMTGFAAQQLIRFCHIVMGYNTQLQPLEKQVEASHALLRYIASGELKVMLDPTAYRLDEAQEAHRAAETGRTAGKVVLAV